MMKIDPSYRLETMAGRAMLVRIKDGAIDPSSMLYVSEALAWLFGRLGDKDFDLDELTELLMGEYDLDKERALADCTDMVDTLLQKGVIIDA